MAEVIPPPSECSLVIPDNLLPWCTLIVKYSEEYKLDSYLVSAVMQMESGGHLEAISRSGAVGLLQVMPRDGKAAEMMCINGPCFSRRPTIKELRDPEFNLDYGCGMLSRLITAKGSVRDALKSYGPADVGYTYADKVIAIYNRLVAP